MTLPNEIDVTRNGTLAKRGRPSGAKNKDKKPRAAKKQKLQSALELASYDQFGILKPSVYVIGDSVTYYLFHLEGIQGLHKRLSELVAENDEKHKPKLIYLGHGYFKFKPIFLPTLWVGTTDPQLKRRNGYISGIYQVYDVQNQCEGILWVYGGAGGSNEWERIKTQIDYALARIHVLGLDTVDANGYLPAIFKIARMPTKLGTKICKLVGWSMETSVITEQQFNEIDSSIARELYTEYPPAFSNDLEDKSGIRLFRPQEP